MCDSESVNACGRMLQVVILGEINIIRWNPKGESWPETQPYWEGELCEQLLCVLNFNTPSYIQCFQPNSLASLIYISIFYLSAKIQNEKFHLSLYSSSL